MACNARRGSHGPVAGNTLDDRITESVRCPVGCSEIDLGILQAVVAPLGREICFAHQGFELGRLRARSVLHIPRLLVGRNGGHGRAERVVAPDTVAAARSHLILKCVPDPIRILATGDVYGYQAVLYSAGGGGVVGASGRCRDSEVAEFTGVEPALGPNRL